MGPRWGGKAGEALVRQRPAGRDDQGDSCHGRQEQRRISCYLLTWMNTMFGAALDERLCRSQRESTLPSIVSKFVRVPDLNIPMWLFPDRKFDPSQS